ncbi:MAG: amidohydrolase [Chitinophagaceae bacterium]|nr:amidohydrolase [Chitinophagaceae bacterium]
MNLHYYLLLLFAIASCRSKTPVDLVVHHGVIYTADSSFSIAEAMAIKDGKITAVGSNAEILDLYTADKMIDAGGRPIYPGFIDAHAHFYGYALSLLEVDLTGTKSWNECLERLRRFVAGKSLAPGQWIVGRGWDQNDWQEKTFPTKDSLDVLFSNNPILLRRIDGHAAIANEAALRLAGLKAGATAEGGLIETRHGRLTGILLDNAIGSVSSLIPEATPDALQVAFKKAEAHCFAVGLTTIVDCGLMRRQVEQIDSLQKNGALRMRVVALLSDATENYDYYLPKGVYKTSRLNVNGFKLFADGALGSRGACLLQPYHDQPGWRGFMLNNTAHFATVLRKIYNSPFQACTHAIGDSANRTILKLYAGILKNKNDRRWRIEHAQIVDTGDLHYFGQFQIIPSVQPTHATSDMYWAEDRLGKERIGSAYAYNPLLQQNGWMSLGTDFPVEDISPMKTFYAAVVRKDASGFPAGGFEISNAISREQTLRGMTIWAARGSFEEKEKGSIEQGKLADFVITDTDIMQCEPTKILQTKVMATYVNGESVFESK